MQLIAQNAKFFAPIRKWFPVNGSLLACAHSSYAFARTISLPSRESHRSTLHPITVITTVPLLISTMNRILSPTYRAGHEWRVASQKVTWWFSARQTALRFRQKTACVAHSAPRRIWMCHLHRSLFYWFGSAKEKSTGMGASQNVSMLTKSWIKNTSNGVVSGTPTTNAHLCSSMSPEAASLRAEVAITRCYSVLPGRTNKTLKSRARQVKPTPSQFCAAHCSLPSEYLWF